jgi:hypothetical protein
MRGAETSYFGVSGGRLLGRLGEPLYGRRYGRVRTLKDLARAGLPVPDGVVITEEAHEVVLETIEKVAVRERVPTWPALLQREVRPLSTGWSTVERAPIETPWVGDDLHGQKVALYDGEPFDEESPERKGITRLTLEAASALGAIPRILWGFEGGRWYVLSTEMVEDEKSVQGWYS